MKKMASVTESTTLWVIATPQAVIDLDVSHDLSQHTCERLSETSDQSGETLEVREALSDEKEGSSYSGRVRNASEWLVVCSLDRLQSVVEPIPSKVLKYREVKHRYNAMMVKVRTIQCLPWWFKVERPIMYMVARSKFRIRQNLDHSVRNVKVKSRNAVCGNEVESTELESFSPFVDFTAIELLLCVTIQLRYGVFHIDFRHTFPNRILDLPMYVELPKQMFDREDQTKLVMKHHRTFFGI